MSTDDRITPLTGTDRYTPLARIGGGGQAEILLARQRGDAGFEKLVVIKRLWPHLAENERMRQDLRHEAQLVARIRHASVCQVLDLIDSAEGPLVVLEYLQGVTMAVVARSLPARRDVEDLRFVVSCVLQVCDALQHAHALVGPDGSNAGLVHRDVSASNILVTADGTVKLLDFGVATSVVSEPRGSSFRGTAAFASPEQIEGRAVDHRADLFSLAVVTYETLAGRGLFRRSSAEATLQAVLDVDPRPLPEHQPLVPPALDRVIRCALAKSASDRFPDAGAFADALGDAIGALGGSMRVPEVRRYVKARLETEIDQRHHKVLTAVQTTNPIQVEPDTVSLRGRWDERTFHALPAVDLSESDDAWAAAAQRPDEDTADLTHAPRVDVQHLEPAAVPMLGTRRRSLIVVAVTVVLAAAAIAVGIFVARSTSTTPPTVAASAPRLDGGITIHEVDAHVAVEPTHPDAGTPVAGASSPSDRPTRRPPPRRASRTNERELPEPSRLPGFLTIDSRPFATIYIAGERKGRVPIYRLPMSPGTYQVKAVTDDGRTKTVDVRVLPDREVRQRFEW